MPENHPVKLSAKQQQMLKHIQRANDQGQSLSEYAKQHDLNKKALYNYHWMLRKKGLLEASTEPPAFVKVTPAPRPKSAAGVTWRIYFPNGIHVQIDGDEKALSGLLQRVYSL